MRRGERKRRGKRCCAGFSRDTPGHPGTTSEGTMATIADVREGLDILSKYAAACKDARLGGAEHDILLGPEVPKGAVSAADAERLGYLGWHWSSEFDCWARFV